MKKMVKRTAVVTLAGVMSVGMLSGCGSKTLDGTKTVATVDGTDIPLGVVSLYAREQQQQTTTMYLNYMGSADNIWDQTAGDDSDETYGDQINQKNNPDKMIQHVYHLHFFKRNKKSMLINQCKD